MKHIVVLENIRSAYNVGNIIRTADALGRDVAFCGYTPTPMNQPKVVKTSLGAENSVGCRTFETTLEAVEILHREGYEIIAAECHEKAIALDEYARIRDTKKPTSPVGKPLAVVFGNEVVGVESETLEKVDSIVMIPMRGEKESLNVGQSVAIFMRSLWFENVP